MFGGILGAATLPVFSDKLRKRKIFIVITYNLRHSRTYRSDFCRQLWLLLAACIVFGFFLMAGGPISYQYSAEICYPAPEATSQGLLMLVGQISGIIFIFGMDMADSGGAVKNTGHDRFHRAFGDQYISNIETQRIKTRQDG